jgi:hypothetical protein
MNDTLAHMIACAERNTQGLAELVWDAAHHACARLTHDLPEAIAHELSELHLEETLKLLRSDAHEQVRYLVKTLGEAEAVRRLTLALESPACVAA